MKKLIPALLIAMEVMLMGVSAASAKTPAQIELEESNRKLVLSLFAADSPEVIVNFMADNYKQHNPTIPDGKAGAAAFFRDLATKYPKAKAHVYRSAADGDLVWVHAHLVLQPNDPGIALVDIFRLKDGKLVEHWDIMQPVPANPANSNSMF